MTTLQAFLLGMAVAWSPALLVLAWVSVRPRRNNLTINHPLRARDVGELSDHVKSRKSECRDDRSGSTNGKRDEDVDAHQLDKTHSDIPLFDVVLRCV
jgi:hypothetical protein